MFSIMMLLQLCLVEAVVFSCPGSGHRHSQKEKGEARIDRSMQAVAQKHANWNCLGGGVSKITVRFSAESDGNFFA